jgi:hypothetical protein
MKKQKQNESRRVHLLQDITVVFLLSFTLGLASALAQAEGAATIDGVSTVPTSLEAEQTATTTPSEVVNEVDEKVCTLESVVCEHEHPYYIEKVITDAALKYGVSPRILLNIAWCESKYRTDIRGVVDERDRGLFQINSHFNPSVSDECAFDAKCSSEWAAKEVSEGHLSKWVCAKLLGYTK